MGHAGSKQRLVWRKARSSSANGARVEVAQTADGTDMRDSKNPQEPIVRYTADEWNAFLAQAKSTETDDSVRHTQTTGAGANDQFGTANLRAFLRGLISAATESDEALNRHLKLFRFARSTLLTIAATALLGSLIFGAGVAAAVFFAGIHLGVAIGIGAGGSASFILTIVVRSRRYLKVAFSALSEADPPGAKHNENQTREDEEQRNTGR